MFIFNIKFYFIKNEVFCNIFISYQLEAAGRWDSLIPLICCSLKYKTTLKLRKAI